MIRTLSALALIVCSLALTACESVAGRDRDHDSERVVTLVGWMTGTFSNDVQAAADPDGYFHIRLVMQPIWTDRVDGHWLYVEQAATSALERPYRQRVYHVGSTADGLVSEIYTLPGAPSDYLHGWVADSPVHGLTPADLTLREGCTIYLEDLGDHFAGGTVGTGCASTLGDATYAISNVTIRAERLVSWDQGFAADGEPAWGPESGGYEFIKTSAAPPAAE